MNKLLILLILILGSCSSKKPKGNTKAEVLYKEAKELVEKERYLAANEQLNLIRSQHPYSYYATPAELMQADILFLQENYVESAAAYILFKDFHPKHKESHYVLYRIGESYYKQIPDTHDRDLTSAHESIKYFNELIRKYPTSKHIKDAKTKINQAKEMIFLKQKYIADFYFKVENYHAAKFRYEKIINQFTNRELLIHAKARLIESTYFLAEYQQCLDYIKNFSTDIAQEHLKLLEDKTESCGKKLKEQIQALKNGEPNDE